MFSSSRLTSASICIYWGHKLTDSVCWWFCPCLGLHQALNILMHSLSAGPWAPKPRTAVYVQRIPALLFPSWQWQRQKGKRVNWPSSNKDSCHCHLSQYEIICHFHTLNLFKYRSVDESSIPAPCVNTRWSFSSLPLLPFFTFVAIGFWLAYLGTLNLTFNLIFNNNFDLLALTPLYELDDDITVFSRAAIYEEFRCKSL